MDPLELAQIFGATFNPDQQLRLQMEEKLSLLEPQPRFLSSVLSLLVEPNVDEGSKLAASIYFKNKCRKYWKRKSSDLDNQSLDAADQQFIKDQILSVMVKSSSQIRSQLQSILGTMLAYGFPESWPEFGSAIFNLLNSNDINATSVGLIGLLELAQMYRFKSSKSRKPLYEAVDALFPLVVKIAETLVNSTDESEQFLVKTAVKSFYYSIQVDLPPPITNVNFFSSWFALFIRVISLTTPSDDLDQDDIDLLQKEPLFKAKKWAHRSLNRLFNRYGCSTLLGKSAKKYGSFAKLYTQNFAPKALETYLQLTSEYTSKKIILTNPQKYLILNFFDDCVKDKVMWTFLKPHAEAVISQFIFPLLCYTESDIELWESSPADFVNKKIDSLDDFNSPILSANNLLIDLIADRRKSTLLPTLQFINGVLEAYNNSPLDKRNEQAKDGALNMMSNLVTPILSNKSPISNVLDKFLIDYVFPEFTSKNKFLRARALDTYTHYSDVEFSNPKVLISIFDQVVALLADPELPVRIYAALAIRPFIENDTIRDYIIQKLPIIVEQLLTITNQVDTDLVTDVIESLAESYASELEPFAIQLAQQLCKSFTRIVTESLVAVPSSNGNAEFDSTLDFDQINSKTMVALGILRTLGTLIINLDSNLNVVAGIEQIVYPIIKFVMDNRIIDLYEESLEIVDCCTFTLKAITPLAFELFNSVYEAFMDNGIDFVEEMLPSLDNFISFGFEFLTTNPEYKNKIFRTIELVMTSDRVGETGRICGCKLIEAMLLYSIEYNTNNPNNKISIDDLVVQFLAFTSHYLSDPNNQPRTTPLWVYMLSVILNSFQYNVDLTLKTLNDIGSLPIILESLVTKQSVFKRVHDKKVYVMGISNLIHAASLNVSSGKPEYQAVITGLPILFKAVLENIKGYSVALKLRTDIEKIYTEDSYDDDALNGTNLDYDSDNEEDLVTEEQLLNELSNLDNPNEADGDFEDDEFGEFDDDNGDDEEDELEEELAFESPISKVSPYFYLSNMLATMQANSSDVFNQLISNISSEEQQVLSTAATEASKAQ